MSNVSAKPDSDHILQRFLLACPDAPTGMVPDLPVCLLAADVWSICGGASQPSGEKLKILDSLN